MVGICNVCKGPVREPYTVCFSCKQKGNEEPKAVEKKDEWRDGAIKGHIQKIVHEFALKFSKTEEEYFILFEKVKPIFEKKLRE